MPPRASGRRYAQAIFEIAREQDRLDQWEGELEFVEGVLADVEFKAFLKHADVPVWDKMRAIETVMAELSPLVRNMVSLLVTKGLVDTVGDLRSAYVGLLDQHRGRQRVQVTTAEPLEPEELERITQFVSRLVKREVVVSTDTDDTILGGVVIQIGDRLLDGSVRSRLDALRNRMHSEVVVPGG